MIIVDAGHYHTEKVVLDVLKEVIVKDIDSVEVDVLLRSGISHTVM